MRLVLLIFAVLVTAGQGHGLELTVEQCVALGLANNPALKAQEASVESSRQDTLIARSGFLPTLQARGSYYSLDDPQRIIIDSNLLGPGIPPKDVEVRGERDFYYATVTLRQTLFAGGRITHAYQRDHALLASARHEFGNQRTQLTYDLKRTFFEALIHQAYIDSYAQQLQARGEGLRVTTALAAEGVVSDDKVLAARSKLLFGEAELLEARQRSDNALDALRRLLGTPPDEELRLTGKSSYPVLQNETPDLLGVALGARDDYKQLEARIRAAEASVKVAQSAYLPQIYAEGGYLRQSETDLALADAWGVSLNLDWPIFEGGKTTAEVGKAKTEKQRLENLRRDLAATIRNEVLAAERSVRQKQLLVEAYQVNLQAEERAYREILAREPEGAVLAADLQEQRAALLLARANYLESIQQLQITLAALEAVTSADVDSLVLTREVYQPDLVPPDGPGAQPNAADPPADPAAPLSAAPETAASPVTALTEADSPHLVQLAAFKSKQRARAYLAVLKKSHPAGEFAIAAADGWHKVRSGPFASRSAAEAALQELGGKGLVVRATGHR